MKFDRIQLNRWFLQHNGNLYPWKFIFDSAGSHLAISNTRRFHGLTFRVQLALFTLYALYIQFTLVEHTINHGIDSNRYHIFGMHLTRSMFGITFSYWGYKFFVEHGDGHKLLYNFVQLGPGKIPFSLRFHFKICFILRVSFVTNNLNYNAADLPRRGLHPIKGSFLQEQILALTPAMIYTFCPMLTVLFLLGSEDKQFAYSLLPTEMQKSRAILIAGAVLEFRFIHFLTAMAHFGAFHCITFVRVIQTALAHCTKTLKQVTQSSNSCPLKYFYKVI